METLSQQANKMSAKDRKKYIDETIKQIATLKQKDEILIGLAASFDQKKIDLEQISSFKNIENFEIIKTKLAEMDTEEKLEASSNSFTKIINQPAAVRTGILLGVFLLAGYFDMNAQDIFHIPPDAPLGPISPFWA